MNELGLNGEVFIGLENKTDDIWKWMSEENSMTAYKSKRGYIRTETGQRSCIVSTKRGVNGIKIMLTHRRGNEVFHIVNGKVENGEKLKSLETIV